MRFGISTHLFHDRRLERDHLAQVAAYGFEAIELFATRSHFDYQDSRAIDRLAEWLTETGILLHSVHAPIMDAFVPHEAGHAPATLYSTAAGTHERREIAVREAAAALQIAKRIPFEVVVVHLGTPTSLHNADDNHRASAVRSLEELHELAAPLGVRVAAEVIPNRLSDALTLSSLIESELEPGQAGICLDFGHAHMMGDLADAIDTVAGHIITTHVHDNHGREDEHLVPYLGSIDWDLALVSMQKIGYDGAYMMEVASGSRRGAAATTPAAVLEQARRARQRFERALAHA